MHYTNQLLEAELQKIATHSVADGHDEVDLPQELPADSFRPLPEVVEFMHRYREYQESSAQVNAGTY